MSERLKLSERLRVHAALNSGVKFDLSQGEVKDLIRSLEVLEKVGDPAAQWNQGYFVIEVSKPVSRLEAFCWSACLGLLVYSALAELARVVLT